MTGVAGAKEIEDSTLDHVAVSASKAFNESRQHRLDVFSITIQMVFLENVNNQSINWFICMAARKLH